MTVGSLGQNAQRRDGYKTSIFATRLRIWNAGHSPTAVAYWMLCGTSQASCAADVEVFNVRACLMGLAARDLARRKDPQLINDLRAGIVDVRQLAKTKKAMPQHFARGVARLGGMIAARCGNRHLARLLRDQLDHTLWGLIWRDRPLDFFTPRRQLAAVREWEELAAAIERGKDDDAERFQKRIFFNARDAAIATLQKTRSEGIDAAGIIQV
jgi:DNA-binding GntR family transcriptional regulator